MRRYGPAIALSLVLCAYLLAVPFRSQLEANADSERDLFRAAALVEHGTLPAAGPAVDYLPITLAPAWSIAVAPALAISKSPVSVHLLHVALVVLGLAWLLTGLRTSLGLPALTALGLLLATSQYLTQVMVRVWHNAMLPGVAFLFLAALFRASQAQTASRRAWALCLAWLLVALMLQLHLVSAAFGLALGAFTAHLWVREPPHRAPNARLPGAITALTVVALIISYAILLWGLDWDQVAALRAERMAARPPLSELISALPAYLRSGWSSPQTAWLGTCVGALALIGALVAVAQALQTRRLTIWVFVLATAILGLGAAWALAGLSLAPRYFNAAVPPLYLLAGLGLERLLQTARVAQSGRAAAALGAAILAVTLFGGYGRWPQNQHGQDRTHAQPSLLEQQHLAGLAAGILPLNQLQARLHGPVFGPLTAFRYVAWAARRAQEPSGLAATEALFAAPVGFPEPQTVLHRWTLDGGSLRNISLLRFQPAFDPAAAIARVADRRCPIALPYRWSHLGVRALLPFGFRPGFDLDRCRTRHPKAPLTITLSPRPASTRLIVVAEWYDLASRYEQRATLQASHSHQALPVKRLTGERFEGLAVWAITLDGSTDLTLALAPTQTLASLDIY